PDEAVPVTHPAQSRGGASYGRLLLCSKDRQQIFPIQKTLLRLLDRDLPLIQSAHQLLYLCLFPSRQQDHQMSLRFPGFAAESESPGVPGLQNLIAHLRPHRLAPAPDRQGQHPDQILRRGLFPQHALKELLQLRPVSAVPDVLRRPGEGLCQGVLFLFTVSLRLRIQRL
ncbi:Cys-tRNA(Pro) deacylase, partial [Dysosmobacter welbionis]